MKNKSTKTPVVLDKYDYKLMSWALYMLLLMTSLMYAFLYGGFYPFTLLFLILSLPILSLLYLSVVYFTFRCSQEVKQRTFVKGEHASYVLHLQNTSFLFIPFITINMHIDGKVICKKMQDVKIALAPFSRRTFEFNIKLLYRGLYDIGVSSIEISDLLNLFFYTIYPPEKKTILVKPRVIQNYQLDDMTARINEGEQSNEYNDVGNDEIVNIRDYVYGDSFRRIHWNLSSKHRRLMIKETKNETKGESIFFLNLDKHEELDEITLSKEDCIIEEVIKHINYHLKKNKSLKMSYFNGGVQTIRGSSQRDFISIYNVLAELRFNQEYSFSQTLETYIKKNQQSNLLYVFTIKLNANMIDILLKIKSKGFNVWVYFIEFDYMDSSELKEEDLVEILAKQNINANRLIPSISIEHKMNSLDNKALGGA